MLNRTTSGLELFARFCQARSTLYQTFKNRTSDTSVQEHEISPHSLLDVFEFLYMLRAANIDSGDKLSSIAMAHNAECERLIKCSPGELARIGLNKTKIKESIFSEKNLKKLKYNYEFAEAIDQSDISRFLFKHMSRETARKAFIVFSQANLVIRIDAGDSVLIKSNGEAEKIFENYLFDMMTNK